MTPRQTERLSLYQQVVKNCDDNPVIVSLAGKPGYYLNGFRSAVAAIPCIDYLATCIKDNKIPHTAEIYRFLLPLAEANAHCLLEFAKNNSNNLLQQKIIYALSHTRVQSQEIRCASFVTIAETLDEWMPLLESYGMNDSILASFNISIENYMGIAPALSKVLTEPEAYQVCFRNVLRTANLLLKEQVDNLMEDIAEEHQRFYLSYRRIRTYGDINYLL